MEAQVRNLLLQDNSPFRKDANFAFICWNMIQKKAVSRNIIYRVGVSQGGGEVESIILQTLYYSLCRVILILNLLVPEKR